MNLASAGRVLLRALAAPGRIPALTDRWWTGLLVALQPLAIDLARGHAWIALLPSWRAGLGLALLTWLVPLSAAAGLAAAWAARSAAQAAGATDEERPVAVFNGLLVGWFIASVWQPGAAALGLTVFCGALVGWLAVALGRLAFTLTGLPVLSLPFVLVADSLSAASGSLAVLLPHDGVPAQTWLGAPWDGVLAAFGALFLQDDPRQGLLVAVIIGLSSRYTLAVACAACALAQAGLAALGVVGPELGSMPWAANALLAAVMVGATVAVPSRSSAALAMWAALVAAWLTVVCSRLGAPLHLAPFSLPFVLTAWVVLYAAARNPRLAVTIDLARPERPERAHERARIARSRIGTPGSLPLVPPYAGFWTVSQGFDGPHTHRGAWRHALDFIVLLEGRSYSGSGQRLEDFHAYGQPVLSPAWGQVCRVVDGIADNAPGAINAAANWGNLMVIRLQGGLCVLLAHLQPGSMAVAQGAWVSPGMLLARCGNSGRSPQPHIHMHLQWGEAPGAPTRPFHLCNVLRVAPGATGLPPPLPPPLPQYHLSLVPEPGCQIGSADIGPIRPLHLLAGRGLRYEAQVRGGPGRPRSSHWSLHCEVDTLGRLVLVSSAGARCAVESTPAVFGCFDRDTTPDPLLDLWLLACGYTPASWLVSDWEEHCTPARLMPGRRARLMGTAVWPWAATVHSRHQRRWDEAAQSWEQTARHRQPLTGLRVHTRACITAAGGCLLLQATAAGRQTTLRATQVFQCADLGVPGWVADLAPLAIAPWAEASD
jgi:murein DD-endopeptidase MepM/ murein hydrolase activator NlpD